MIDILTVCTGNICRSPLAAAILQARLADAEVRVSSAGTQGLHAAPMTRDAQRLARREGVPDDLTSAHRSRLLTEGMLFSPDLVIAMSREHRTRVLSLAPALMRRTFTARELARIGMTLTDDQIADAARGATPSERLRNAAALFAGHRAVARPGSPEDDDVVDPFQREWAVYEQSAEQLLPGVAQVERIVGLVA